MTYAGQITSLKEETPAETLVSAGVAQPCLCTLSSLVFQFPGSLPRSPGSDR